MSSPASALSLLIAGDGPLLASLHDEVARLQIGSFVRFLGHVDYNQLPTVYSRARCLVLPSTVEQWGLVVNEALAAGRPVLLSNRCGAAADLLLAGKNGYSFDPYDEIEIAECILKITSCRDLQKFRAASIEKAAQWGLERFGSGLKACIDIAVGRPKKRHFITWVSATAASTLAH